MYQPDTGYDAPERHKNMSFEPSFLRQFGIPVDKVLKLKLFQIKDYRINFNINEYQYIIHPINRSINFRVNSL